MKPHLEGGKQVTTRLGLSAVLPTNEFGRDAAAIRDWAQAADDLGYERIVAYDHVVGAVHEDRDPPLWGPYNEHDEFHEPLVLFGFLAAVTRRVQLSTGLLVLPQRQTVLVAKQAAEVDILSGGRLTLGVGIGWNPVEYEALGVPWAARAPRMEEQIGVLRRLWSEPVVDLDTSCHRVDRAGIVPLPGRDIPIWCGGFVPEARERAARLADGFIFSRSDAETCEAGRDLLARVANAGRDVDAFRMESIISYSLGPDRWAADAEAWADAGGRYMAVRTFDRTADRIGVPAAGLQTIVDHIAALGRFHDELR
jgi:probable F420-dependent oxidoreductase